MTKPHSTAGRVTASLESAGIVEIYAWTGARAIADECAAWRIRCRVSRGVDAIVTSLPGAATAKDRADTRAALAELFDASSARVARKG